MPSVDHLIPFAIATFLFAIFPGPALLYTAAQTLARGRSAAFTAADLVTVLLTSSVLGGLRRHGLAQRAASLLGGSVLIGLGARLAISRD